MSKTLLSWNAGRKPELPPAEGGGPAPDVNDPAGEAGGGSPRPDRRTEEPLASDRPDFTEASSTVGRGRVQLEAGYTFARARSGGVTTTSHSYPEALLRVGMIADWFEFRVGQNFGAVRAGSPGAPATVSLPVSPTDTSSDTATLGGNTRTRGAEDLYLGIKFGLTEQKGVLPETALVVQTQVPTGSRDFTAGRVLPGLNLLYGWEVIEDRLSCASSTQANRAVDADAHGYVELAQSLTVGYTLTNKLGAYTEWFAFFPAGATAEGVTAQHYANGGLTYRVTPNLQLDVRAGLGLSRSADDFFTGTGFAVRY